MPGNENIKIDPALVQALSATPSNGAGTTDNITNTLSISLNMLLSSISPLAGEPIIGAGATALMEALDNAGAGLTMALACFATGMRVMGPAMANGAQLFSSTDSSLASTFQELERLLPQFESYATTVKLQVPTEAEITGLDQYIEQAKQGKIPVRFNVATMAVGLPPLPPKGMWENLWDHTGGAAVHYVSQHAVPILIGAGVGAITVAGILLTPVTGGASDVGAAAADSALLGTEAVVGTAATETAVATTATVGSIATVTAEASISSDVAALEAMQSFTVEDLPANMQLPNLTPTG